MPLTPPRDKSGMRFGKLTVKHMLDRREIWGQKKVFWLCICDCGKEIELPTIVLRNVGGKKSCGCDIHSWKIKHGHAFHGDIKSEYSTWTQMKGRCINPKHKGYSRYGARGIKVCDRWLKFENFIADMSSRPTKKHSLERINNDGDYCPENCKWDIQKNQSNNTRKNVFIECAGHRKTISQWAEFFKINYHTLHTRLNKNKNAIQDLWQLHAK